MKISKFFVFGISLQILVLLGIFSLGTTQLNAQACDCTEYIYLNEPNADATLKFRVNANGSLTEIINPATPNGHWAEGTTIQPHGLGTDLNGFIYIGNITTNPATDGVDKYDCAGNLVQADAIPPGPGDAAGGVSGYATNIYSVGNTLYMNSWPTNSNIFREIWAYDICSGDALGKYRWCTGGNAWDFHIDPENNLLYINNNAGVLIGDLDTYLDGDCIPLAFSDDLDRGIVVDEDGFIYVRNQGSDLLRKYDPNGTLLWETDLNVAGGANGWGLTYSEDLGYLYLGANDADCISVYDAADGSYVLQGAANNGGAGSKAIGILKECCPNPNNFVVDTFICVGSQDADIFLQELINCDGVICEGGWVADPSNTGMSLNDCNNTVALNSNQACGTFELFSDGSSAMSQCGQFSITVNIEIAVTPEITITGNQSFCPGEPLTDLTVASNSTTASIQWQMSTTSCTGPWTDIAGATSSTYTPAGLTGTTYYQVVMTEVGGCANGSCDSTSDCITVALEDNCPTPEINITKDVDLSTASLGSPVVFTITIENATLPTTNVVVTDNLPAGLVYNGVHTASTGTFDGTTWTIGNMAAGQIETLQITTIVDAEGVIENEATVVSDETGTILRRDGACVSVPIQVCDNEPISVDIIAEPGLTNYQWYKDGVLITGATSDTYTATETGTYTYTVDGAGPTGDCEGELCCPVVIEQITCCAPIICLPITVTKLN